jgi:hypothetical protein
MDLLREQFQHSFVPRMSEDGTESPMVTPMIVPKIAGAMVSPKVTGAMINPSLTEASITPSTHERRITNSRVTPKVTEARITGYTKKITGARSSRIGP